LFCLFKNGVIGAIKNGTSAKICVIGGLLSKFSMVNKIDNYGGTSGGGVILLTL
jgi:hypothetical protein